MPHNHSTHVFSDIRDEYYNSTQINNIIPRNFKFTYSEHSMNQTIKNGYINILNLYYKSGLKIKYDSDAIDLASKYGHIKILEWFVKYSFKFKYTNYAIDSA